MKNILNKITACIISIILVTPSGVFAADQNTSEKEIARIITSSENKADKTYNKEITLSIMAAMAIAEKEPNLRNLLCKGHMDGLKEMQALFYKWEVLTREYPNHIDLAFKNAKDNLLAKYKKELDLLWEKRNNLTFAQREERIILESKVFAIERITFIKEKSALALDMSVKPGVISDLAQRVVGKDFIEQVSLDITRSIDITGVHSYMGYNMNNVRETVIGFLNNIVDNRYSERTALTKRTELNAIAQADINIDVIRRTMSTEKGKESFRKFLQVLNERLPKKVGVIGITAVAVIGGGLLLLGTSEAGAQTISNSRLAVSRELKSALSVTPSLLSTKIITLRNAYGVNVVSSVIYENRETMLPLVKRQFAAMQMPEVKAKAARLMKDLQGTEDFDAAKDAAFKKAQVITAVRDNTYVKAFNAKMAPLRLK